MKCELDNTQKKTIEIALKALILSHNVSFEQEKEALELLLYFVSYTEGSISLTGEGQTIKLTMAQYKHIQDV